MRTLPNASIPRTDANRLPILTVYYYSETALGGCVRLCALEQREREMKGDVEEANLGFLRLCRIDVDALERINWIRELVQRV